MKIGTDGVLLGAWVPTDNNPYSILDIGSGTGILSLMLAQRCGAEQIDAIEIEDNAFEQCVENFENSPWNDRLYCFHTSLENFVEEMEDEEYDIIVSNPPFYSSDFKTENLARDTARFQDSLPFEELIVAVSKLLSDNGIFATIIPYKEEKRLINLAHQFNLFPNKITRIKGTPNTEIKRSLLAFSRDEGSIGENELIIETSRHQYTADYIALTRDFYQKM